MIKDDLFRHVLIRPAVEERADRLLVVSGFATASLADRHLSTLKDLGVSPSVDLIVGMARTEGIPLGHHNGFCNLTDTYKNGFRCRYLTDVRPAHSKLYIWTREDQPVMAWTGSANYTLTGFGDGQRELLAEVDGEEGRAYFHDLEQYSTDCTDGAIADLVRLYRQEDQPGTGVELPQVVLPLYSKKLGGKVPDRSGLNWGKRPGRDPDQAYIAVPIDIARSDFFPETAQQFTVLTDDNLAFVCVVAQENRKAIHTTLNNAILGKYFRSRMGLPSGALVTREHLQHYGRDEVRFYKIDDETYHLDFAAGRR